MRNVSIVWIAAIVCAQIVSAETQIDDPAAFVAKIYRNFGATAHGSDFNPPEDIYTPRLKALFAEDDRRSQGEVGCIDFVFWLNAQDWEIKNVRITSQPVKQHPDRKLIIATFVNFGEPQEIHFDFVQIAGRWRLDDAHSLKREPWTLSEILKCWQR